MIDAADAVAKAKDFGCRVRGIAPGARRLEIACPGVASLKIAEDGQRRVIRGRIGHLDRRRDRRKMGPILVGEPNRKGVFQWDRRPDRQ
jgi:hypothetical protein